MTSVLELMELVGRHGYALVFLGALAESTAVLGFVLPGGTAVALAGAGARVAGLSLPLLVLLGAAGMLAGAIANYHLGRMGVARALRHPWLGAWGPRLEAQLEDAAPLLHRHGWWVTLVAFAFGAGRSWLAVAAGAGGFPLRRLLAMQLPASLLWSGLYAGGGYLLADQWGLMERAVRQAGVAGVIAVILGAGGWWTSRRWRSRTVLERHLVPELSSAPEEPRLTAFSRPVLEAMPMPVPMGVPVPVPVADTGSARGSR